ncbi:MAG: cyclase family protein [Fimbriimonas sp.]|nr:cyclase family protein [Fimbriimonas sp.]
MPNPWIDISLAIEEGIPQWPGDEAIQMSRICEVGRESIVQITKLDWISHMSTHMDAPAHFIEGGAGIDSIPLTTVSGDAIVVEVEGESIMLADIPSDCRGLCMLFKTLNGALCDVPRFSPNYVYFEADAAEALVDRGAKLVGIDYLSVDQWGTSTYPCHYILLGAGIPILEGLDLRHVEPGHYELVAFPLRIVGCDGSPARAAIRKQAARREID